MKLYAPKYYERFSCIADKCKHSCCIGWEIDIDSNTLERYGSLDEGYGEEIRNSIATEGTPHFTLSSDDRCPHLDRDGLCRIIKSMGEGYLCDICREHPRYYNYVISGKEVGIGISCEEACRIVLESDDYSEICEIDEIYGVPEEFDFDALKHRSRLYEILSNRAIAYTERLERIYREFDVSPAMFEDAEWHSLIDSLEYLHAERKELFLRYSSALIADESNEKYLERALAYFIYRHCSEAFYFDGFLAALGFALFCERLLASLLRSDTALDAYEFARIISEELEYCEDNSEAIKDQFYF